MGNSFSSQVAIIDTLRSLGSGSISGTYAAVGSAFTSPVRIICITNNTDGDMLFTTDVTKDMLFIPKGSFKLFDLTTNGIGSYFVLRVGTQFYVKQSTAPTTGSVYIEVILGS